MPEPWVLPVVVVVLLVAAWYLTYTAARLDRLHTRVEGALSALDGQLVRRAEVAQAIAASGLLDPAASLALAGTAVACLDAEPFAGDTLDESGLLGPRPTGDRVALENELTGLLRDLLDPRTLDALGRDPAGAELLDRLAAVGLRVHLAARFHADAVEDALRVRAKPTARLFRLAGHAAEPATVPLDDRLPELPAGPPRMGG